MPPNLLLDQPPPTAPDHVWHGRLAVSDITYLPLGGGGWFYLASCRAACADGFVHQEDSGLAGG